MSKLLFVIDMQNDFITGALGSEAAQAIVPNVLNKIKNFINSTSSENGKIIFTRDTHFEDNYLSSLEGQNLPVMHCIAGTEGWALDESISKEIFDNFENYETYIFNKETFGLYDWVSMLSNHANVNFNEIESIEIIGLCTDICVISNAMILKSLFPEIPITVDSSCCAGVTPESHNNALSAMKMCHINII